MQDSGGEVKVAVVWINVLESDDADAARAAQALFGDRRVRQFWDPEQLAGRAWGKALVLNPIAWDVYLLFDPNSSWSGPAPLPSQWFHQLGGGKAAPSRRRSGHGLAAALYSAGQAGGWPLHSSAPLEAAWRASHASALDRLRAAKAGGDTRCSVCREEGQGSSCSVAGWRRLLLRTERGGRLIISGGEPMTLQDHGRIVHLSIVGLSCPECMVRAAGSLVSVRGVREVEVLLDEGQAVVQFLPTAIATDEDLALALRGQGFGAALVLSSPAR